MSFAGHVLDMIKKQRQNRILQQQNRERFHAKKARSKSYSNKKFNTEKFPEKSKSEIQLSKRKIHLETARENKIIIAKFFTFLIFLSLVLYSIWEFLNS